MWNKLKTKEINRRRINSRYMSSNNNLCLNNAKDQYLSITPSLLNKSAIILISSGIITILSKIKSNNRPSPKLSSSISFKIVQGRAPSMIYLKYQAQSRKAKSILSKNSKHQLLFLLKKNPPINVSKPSLLLIIILFAITIPKNLRMRQQNVAIDPFQIANLSKQRLQRRRSK